MVWHSIRRRGLDRFQQIVAGLSVATLPERNEGTLIPAAGLFEPIVAFGQLPFLPFTNFVPPPDWPDLFRFTVVQIGGQLNPSLIIVPKLDDSSQPFFAKPTEVVPGLQMKAGLDDLGPEQHVRRPVRVR